MPTDTSRVGPQTLPLDGDASITQLDDPIVSALLSLLAHVTKATLDPRLANIPSAPADACPVANRFAFDPFDPRANHVRRPVPSLFVWWDGKSTPWNHTILIKGRIRRIRAMYIYPDLPSQDSLDDRRGLFSTVDAAWAKASERGGHPTWSFNGKPTGTRLEHSWGYPQRLDWEWIGGQEVRRVGIDARTPEQLKKSGRDYPGFVALFQVREEIEGRQPVDPDDVTRESTVALWEDDVPILERYFGGPDGSEDP